MSPKARWFWSLAAVVLVADVVTKRFAEQALQPRHVPHEIVGDVLRFTLTYNPGAAFSMSLGEYSRWGFAIMATIVLVVLLRSLATTDAGDAWQGAAIGLVSGGALGNLVDRLRHVHGVVDFIDIGLGDIRFWTFNVADMGVTFGAIMLIIAMLKTPANASSSESIL